MIVYTSYVIILMKKMPFLMFYICYLVLYIL